MCIKQPETGDLADTTLYRHRRILQFITTVKSLIPSVRSPIISPIMYNHVHSIEIFKKTKSHVTREIADVRYLAGRA